MELWNLIRNLFKVIEAEIDNRIRLESVVRAQKEVIRREVDSG